MPTTINFHSADDPRDVVHQVVQKLVEGELVGLPTDTVYSVVAYALHETAVRRLEALIDRAPDDRCALAVKAPAEALDYFPSLPAPPRRLFQRFWPAPITLVAHDNQAQGLAARLPEGTRAALGRAGGLGRAGDIGREGGLALRLPDHALIKAVQRLLPAPLVIAGETLSSTALSSPEGCGRAEQLSLVAGEELSLIVDAGTCRYGQPSTVVRVGDDGWKLLRPGPVSQRTLQRQAGTLYLFVCTGNTCRSPMAEGLFRRLLSEKLKITADELADHGYLVASAGVSAGIGGPASPESVDVMERRGIDISSHQSRQVTPELLSQADYVYTMTRGHRDCLMREFPEMAALISLLARDGSDVIDPIGAGPDEYQRCAEQIERHLRSIIAEIPVS